ncbi:hypothetical protein EJD97_007043 [Solanum chilense]|uniref:S-protein homolog n=1 Tax=Solanum chilense TaxID=4083 RepID=A0A6N2BPN0_SOLCI|nr:hypothetical protein EJD97_007043 [Solanum chilense]
MEPGESYQMAPRYDHKGNNTVSCEMKLRDKHGVFMLFDSNDDKTCHSANEACEWSIREDGLCMLIEDNCVIFKWNTTTHYSFRNIASEPIKYVARGNK